MSGSFQQKSLRATFTLGTGGFGGGANNQLVLTGLRMCASLSGGLGFMTTLDLQVFGMAISDMRSLIVMVSPGNTIPQFDNTVLLEANDGDGNWYAVYNGLIVEGGPDFTQMPEVFYHCQAIPAMAYLGNKPVTPLSYQSATTVSQVCSSIASSMGATLNNPNAISASIAKGACFSGSPLTQLEAARLKSGGAFTYTFDPPNTLTILPPNKTRTGPTVAAFSPQSGLIGYPTIELTGVCATVLFNKTLLQIGSQIQITGSDLTVANGLWMPFDQTVQLDAYKLGGGQWHCQMHCFPVAS